VHVVEYLGRYTHKIAISNNRLVSYKDGKVRFTYKDYRQGACKKEMELTDTEFIRRFALHIPPSRFIRIRHYGILSSTSKKVTIPSIRQQFGTQEISFIDLRKHNSFNIGVCPCCGSLSMVTVQTIPSRGPPRLRPVAIPVEPERQNATT